jgi:phenylacetate-CoA ligase
MLRYLSAWVLYPLAERRLGRAIRSKAAVLRRQFRAGFGQRRAWAQTQLAAVLTRAGRDVPYYRDLFRQIRFNPSKVAADLAYLQDLPYLTKEIVRAEGPRLISAQVDPSTLQVRTTGGSTGPSTRIYYSPEALDWTAAANLVSLEWAGKRPHMRELHLASRYPEAFPWRDRLKEHVKTIVLNRTNLFTDNFDPPALDAVWRRVRKARPYLIQGHPSTLYALAAHLRRGGVRPRRAFDVFESTGEVLDPKKRETIEAVFGCRVIDRYGNAEFGVLAHERLEEPRHRLQVLDPLVWPEIAAREGRSELVFTALRNDAMPLVRYRTGDLGELETADDGFYLRRIVGRVHDLVRIGEHRYPTHYVQDVLDRIGGVDEFQIVQSPTLSLLRLVVPEATQRELIARKIKDWWGDAVRLEFTDFDGLTRRGWRSKFCHLVDAPAVAS